MNVIPPVIVAEHVNVIAPVIVIRPVNVNRGYRVLCANDGTEALELVRKTADGSMCW